MAIAKYTRQNVVNGIEMRAQGARSFGIEGEFTEYTNKLHV